MIYLFVAWFLVLITIPLSINTKVLVSVGDKKIFYSISCYRFFKLNSGFIDFTNNKAILRYSRRKTKALMYKDFLPDQNKTEVFKHIDFTRFSSAILVGGEDDVKKLSTCATINNITASLYAFLKTEKPYLKFKNDVVILNKDDKSGGLFDINIVINGIALIKILFKKIYKGVLEYAKRKVG